MVALAGLILAISAAFMQMPNRRQDGPLVSRLDLRAVQLDPAAFGALRLAGAWEATSTDPRFGGFSGLALEGGRLLAVTDAGSLAWFDKPFALPTSVTMSDLPAGPGNPRYKRNRDVEALVADSRGRGWWVSFERANDLWLYDPQFSRPLRRIRLRNTSFSVNQGVEGLALDGHGLLLFPEGGDELYRLKGPDIRRAGLIGKRASISESARLPDGRLIALERALTRSGFKNALVMIEEAGAAYRVRSRFDLPLGSFDNMEGMTAEPLPDGATRLWMIADDNFQRPQRTLLLALDVPPAGRAR